MNSSEIKVTGVARFVFSLLTAFPLISKHFIYLCIKVTKSKQAFQTKRTRMYCKLALPVSDKSCFLTISHTLYMIVNI